MLLGLTRVSFSIINSQVHQEYARVGCLTAQSTSNLA